MPANGVIRSANYTENERGHCRPSIRGIPNTRRKIALPYLPGFRLSSTESALDKRQIMTVAVVFLSRFTRGSSGYQACEFSCAKDFVATPKQARGARIVAAQLTPAASLRALPAYSRRVGSGRVYRQLA